MTTVADLIKQHSDDSLSLKEGHVYQIWEDGEITIQKSGSLLNQRTLHIVAPAFDGKAAPLSIFPHRNSCKHGWAYVTQEAAYTIRLAIWEVYVEVGAEE